MSKITIDTIKTGLDTANHLLESFEIPPNIAKLNIKLDSTGIEEQINNMKELKDTITNLRNYIEANDSLKNNSSEQLTNLKQTLVVLTNNIDAFSLELRELKENITNKSWFSNNLDKLSHYRDKSSTTTKVGIGFASLGLVFVPLYLLNRKLKKSRFGKISRKVMAWGAGLSVVTLSVKYRDQIKFWFGNIFENKEKKKEQQLVAEQFASEVDGITFNKESDKYEYGTYSISRSKIINKDQLIAWKAKIQEDASKGKKVTLNSVRQGIETKLKTDQNYMTKCEKIGNSVNKYFSLLIGGNFNALGTNDYEYLGDKNTKTSGLIVAQLDLGYPPISNLLKLEFINNIQDLTKPEKWNELTFEGQQFVYKQIADTLSMYDVGIMRIDNLTSHASEQMRQIIIKSQVEHEDKFKNLNSIFAQQMQVVTFINYIKKRLSYKLIEKDILQSNGDDISKLTDDGKKQDLITRLIQEKMQDKTYMLGIDTIINRDLLNNNLTYIVDETNPSYNLFEEILSEPIDNNMSNTLSKSNTNINTIVARVDQQKINYNIEESTKIAEDFLSMIDNVGASAWYSVWMDAMGVMFNTRNVSELDMLKGTNYAVAFEACIQPTKMFLEKIKKGEEPTEDDFTNLHNAIQEYKYIYNHIITGATIKQEIIKTERGPLVRYMLSFSAFGKGVYNHGIELWQDGNGREMVGYGATTAVTLDVLTRAPRKFVKTSRFMLGAGGVNSIKLNLSLLDKTGAIIVQQATQHIQTSARPRYARNGFFLSNKLYSGPNGKILLIHDFANGKLNPKIACQIATDLKLFNDSSTINLEKLLMEATGNTDTTYIKNIAKLIEQNPDLLQKGGIINIKKDSDSRTKLFLMTEKKKTFSINTNVYNAMINLNTTTYNISLDDIEALIQNKNFTVVNHLDGNGTLVKLTIGGKEIVFDQNMQTKYASIIEKYKHYNYTSNIDEINKLNKEFANNLLEDMQNSIKNRKSLIIQLLNKNILNETSISSFIIKLGTVDLDGFNNKTILSFVGGLEKQTPQSIINDIIKINKIQKDIQADLVSLYTSYYQTSDSKIQQIIKSQISSFEDMNKFFKNLSSQEKVAISTISSIFPETSTITGIINKIMTHQLNLLDGSGSLKTTALLAEELGLSGANAQKFIKTLDKVGVSNFLKILKISELGKKEKLLFNILNIII